MIENKLKKIIFILSLCSLVLLPSCSVFESTVLNSKPQKKVYHLDTATVFTKSVIRETDIEKKSFSRQDDSLMFFEDLKENESYLLHKLYDSTNTTLSGITLKKMGLEYDSIQIVSNPTLSKATFYSNKKSVLYDIKKTCYITFNRSKIVSKTIKIKQQLLNEEQKELEVNYNYKY